MRKYEFSVNSKSYSVTVLKYATSQAELEINGRKYSIKLDTSLKRAVDAMTEIDSAAAASGQPPIVLPVETTKTTTTPKPSSIQASKTIVAPIPGSILAILVKEGDKVTTDQTVIKMEAMKMENNIQSTMEGVVKEIRVKIKEAVNKDQVLIVIE